MAGCHAYCCCPGHLRSVRRIHRGGRKGYIYRQHGVGVARVTCDQINTYDGRYLHGSAGEVILPDHEGLNLAIMTIVGTIPEPVHLAGYSGICYARELRGGITIFEAS